MLVECSNCGMHNLSSNNVCAFCGADIKKDSFRDKLKHDVSLIALGLWMFTILNYFFHNTYLRNIVQGLDLAFASTLAITLILDPLLKRRKIKQFIKKRYLEIIYASPILRPLMPASRNVKLLTTISHNHHFLRHNFDLIKDSRGLKYYIKKNRALKKQSKQSMKELNHLIVSQSKHFSFYNPNRKIIKMYA